MTREELLRKLEARIERTLGQLGIDATVVSLGRNGWIGGSMMNATWGAGGTDFSIRSGRELDLTRKYDDSASNHGLSDGVLPLSLQAGGDGVLSDDVLEVVRETVREFVAEHAVDFVRHFSTRPDPKTLN